MRVEVIGDDTSSAPTGALRVGEWGVGRARRRALHAAVKRAQRGPRGWHHVIRRSGSAAVELLRFSHSLCRGGSVCSVPPHVLRP